MKVKLFENFDSENLLTKIEDELMDFIDDGILSIYNEEDYEIVLVFKELPDETFDKYAIALEDRSKTVLKLNHKIKKLCDELDLEEVCFIFTNGINGTMHKEGDKLYISLRKNQITQYAKSTIKP